MRPCPRPRHVINRTSRAGAFEQIRELPKIAAPTLVIAGRYDQGTPLEANQYIAEHIPNARIAVLEAAHLSNIELPQLYADTVLKFLLS